MSVDEVLDEVLERSESVEEQEIEEQSAQAQEQAVEEKPEEKPEEKEKREAQVGPVEAEKPNYVENVRWMAKRLRDILARYAIRTTVFADDQHRIYETFGDDLMFYFLSTAWADSYHTRILDSDEVEIRFFERYSLDREIYLVKERHGKDYVAFYAYLINATPEYRRTVHHWIVKLINMLPVVEGKEIPQEKMIPVLKGRTDGEVAVLYRVENWLAVEIRRRGGENKVVYLAPP